MERIEIQNSECKTVGYVEAAHGATITKDGQRVVTDGIQITDASRQHVVIITNDGIRLNDVDGGEIGLWHGNVHITGNLYLNGNIVQRKETNGDAH